MSALHLLHQVPERLGTLPLVGGGLTAAVLVSSVVVLARRKGGWWLSGIGPQAIVALGGVGVSVHGLWRFAAHTAQLPLPMRVGFIGVFDAAEMVLLVMLYRQADPKRGWTPELRLMHRTAWTLVGFSAAMNAIDAPNWWARPVLAAIPPLATWLIELQLRSKLRDADKAEDTEAKPGPARLVVLLWRHAWAELFAALGLDARTSSSAIARAALAQRAAQQLYRLRLALEDKAATPQYGRAGTRQKKRVTRLRRRAQKGVDRGDVATDPVQGIALARRMAGLTGVDDVALLDYSDAPAVRKRLEDLTVTAAVHRLDSSALAEEITQAAQNKLREAEEQAASARQRAAEVEERAEAARQQAEYARRRAEEETRAAREAKLRAEEDTRQAKEELDAARQEAERAAGARQDAESARQRAADDLDASSTRARELGEQVSEAERRLATARRAHEQIQRQTGDAGTLRAELATLQDQLTRVRSEHHEAATAARTAQGQADSARRELEQLSRSHREAVAAVEQAERRRVGAEREARAAGEHTEQLQAQTREAETVLARLLEQIAEHAASADPADADPVEYRSPDKQSGWQYYLSQVRAGGEEPSARQLAERYGVNEGNARNWVRDFRAAHTAQLAARLPRGAARDHLHAVNGAASGGS